MGKTPAVTAADILVDTREQRPLFATAERATLATGDYTLRGYEDRIAVERKSVADLYGSCRQRRLPFMRATRRLSTYKCALVLIEGDEAEMRAYADKLAAMANKGRRGRPARTMTFEEVRAFIIANFQLRYKVPAWPVPTRDSARSWLKHFLTLAKRRCDGADTPHDPVICKCGGGAPPIGHGGRCANTGKK